MSYIVVEFLSEGSVAVVAKCWTYKEQTVFYQIIGYRLFSGGVLYFVKYSAH